jgi:hypothetical protein
MKRISLALALAFAAAAAFAAPDFKSLLREIDEMGDFGKEDFTAVYSITSQKPNEKATNTEIKIYRRDELDQLVITIRKPKDDKGKGYLKQGDTVLFYDPAAGEPVPATVKNNVGNSDAQNGDFKKYTFAEDYDIVKTGEAVVAGVPSWVLYLKSRTKDVNYEKIRLTVRKDKAIPLIEEDFAASSDFTESGLMRTIKYALDYVQVGDKQVPRKIRIVDEFNKGQMSLLEISDLAVGKLDDSIFTTEYLKFAQ